MSSSLNYGPFWGPSYKGAVLFGDQKRDPSIESYPDVASGWLPRSLNLSTACRYWSQPDYESRLCACMRVCVCVFVLPCVTDEYGSPFAIKLSAMTATHVVILRYSTFTYLLVATAAITV